MIISGNTIISVGNEGDENSNFINVNYSDVDSGKLLKNDSILFIPDNLTIPDVWNIMFSNYSDFITPLANDIILGFNYQDSAGSKIKWKSCIYSIIKEKVLSTEFNKDTFSNSFVALKSFKNEAIVVNQWKNPISDLLILPNYEFWSIDSFGHAIKLFSYNNTNAKRWSITRAVYDDNQSDSTLILNQELAWDFRGVPEQYSSFVWKKYLY
ncbi:MAG: hypothetical protein KDC92_16140 [Bacteroidetes bacterium]|nr:hypothetical protein [Bacteroidota bacterium]